MNHLYFGDCLTIIRDRLKLSSVDLIYLDPPFNSNRSYNAIYKTETGRPLPDQIEAFCDTWTLDAERERAIRSMPVLMREAGIDDGVAQFWKTWMDALRNTQPRLLAYLAYMVERLIWMKSILKPTGSIYLHCDPTCGHYIKVMMDSVFGHDNFQNEIIWKRTGAHGGARRWGPIHDIILFYSAGQRYKWNRILEEYDEGYIDAYYKDSDEHGYFQPISLTGPGSREGYSGKEWRGIDPGNRHWALPSKPAIPDWFIAPQGYSDMTTQEQLDVLDKQDLIYWPTRGSIPRFKRYASVAKGNPIQDIITDIRPVQSHAKERLGYATQKPLKLLERIIKASSDEGDVVLDPFCGCATTIEAAHNLKRRWIGIDIAIHAIKRVSAVRLQERLHLVEGKDYEIEGVPGNIEGAQDLWKRDKYHFQQWAVEQVGGFVTTKRTGDGGIDGRIYFETVTDGSLESMIVEVKGGKNVNIESIRALRGVLDDGDALLAGLVIMELLGTTKARNFDRFMASAGDLEVGRRTYPKMQILSVEEILEGKIFDTPHALGRRQSDQHELELSAR